MITSANSRVVEIVGAAGAGKSTLCQTLARAKHFIRLSNFPDVRNISNAPFFLWHGLQISPALLALYRKDSRELTRREFAWLSILHGWPARLQEELQSNKVIILDQGPAYLFTELCEFGPDYLKRDDAKNFWQSLFLRWSNSLDAIVWLDAADSDLIKRIRNREKEHIIKNESDETVLAFVNRYRRAYERIILKLTMSQPHLKIIRFDASQDSPEEISSQFLSELDLI